MSANLAHARESEPGNWLVDGGDMGRLVRSMDWGATGLGPLDFWPVSLRTAVNLCLASNSPLCVIWGTGLLQIYNDAYRSVCGSKHPTSMGRSYRECWACDWPAIGAAFEHALAGHTSQLENQRLFPVRSGYLEEAFLTFAFSPIRDESGAVAGLLHPITDNTGQVLAQRRLDTVRELSGRAARAHSTEEVFALVGQSLSGSGFDIPFALFYHIDSNFDTPRLAAATSSVTLLQAAGSQIAAPALWPLAQAIRERRTIQVDNLQSRFGELSCGPYPEQPRHALVIPIMPLGERTAAVLILGISSRLPLNAEYRGFVDLIATTITTASNSALTRHRPTLPGRDLQQADSAPDRQYRILWADENPGMREYVRQLLAKDYEVMAVANGAEAVATAMARTPDLVLSDSLGSGMSAFEVLRALRANETTRTVPFILLSARGGEESTIEGLEAGADDYLVKPFSARELLARVRTHVQMAGVRREWQSELESRVQGRTAALQETMHALETENAERQLAQRKLEEQVGRMSLLDRITRAAAERQDLRSIFQVVVRTVEESLPVDFCSVWLYDASSNSLTIGSAGSKSAALAAELSRGAFASAELNENGLGHCASGNVLHERDLRTIRMPLQRRMAADGLRALVATPLVTDRKLYGILLVARRSERGFMSGECEFLRQLGEHVALAARQAGLQEDLQHAYDELRQTQQAVMQQERLRALGQMASGMAHDINNAISPIALYVESLLEQDTTLSDKAKKYLPIIQRAIDDVSATVARMREFYRQRAPQSVLTPVPLNALVVQVLDLTRARWSDMPQQRGVVIRTERNLPPDLPDILGIESEIREALTNLIFNAVDAMPEGGTLTIETRKLEGCAGVCVEVTDSGIGMNEETRSRCLEPFYTTKGERGTGLGLAMVFGMARRHNAAIEIDSALGSGTTVRLVFLVPTAPAVSVQIAPSTEPLRKLRLLVIDDDAVLLKALAAALESEGHTVVPADIAAQGVAAFRASLKTNERFAAVITDLGMPHMDGRQVSRAIKSASPATPVILLTGWGQPSTLDDDTPATVDRVLSKPPKLGQLREALTQLCPQGKDGH